MLVRFFQFYSTIFCSLAEALQVIIGIPDFWFWFVVLISFFGTMYVEVIVSTRRECLLSGYVTPNDRLKYRLLGLWYWLGLPFIGLNFAAFFYALYPVEDSMVRGFCASLLVHGGAVFMVRLMNRDTRRSLPRP